MNGSSVDLFLDENSTFDEDFEREDQSSLFETTLCIVITITVILFSSFCLIIFLFSPRQIRSNFKNPTGYIMTWLSIIDFVSGFILLIPMSVTVTLDHKWQFGRSFCGIQGMVLQLVQNMANTLLMTVAVDRFCALVTPIRYLYLMSTLTKKTYLLFSLFVVLYSSFFPVASAIYFNAPNFDGQLLCFIYSPSLQFTLCNFVINAVIPLVIMVTCYAAIIVALCRAKHGGASASQGNAQNLMAQTASLTKHRESNESAASVPGTNYKMIASNSVERFSVTPESTCSRRHVSHAKEQEERNVIKRAYNLFLTITVIFILTWVPYMSVDFIYKNPPAIVYKLTTYLIFTISLSNFPLFLTYNRSFRSASATLVKMWLCPGAIRNERARNVRNMSQNTRRQQPGCTGTPRDSSNRLGNPNGGVYLQETTRTSLTTSYLAVPRRVSADQAENAC